jgi:DNA integrity scanning protein DisA with diadenylate cyclase activity
MGARMLFSWDGATWRLYPGRTLATRLFEELRLLSSRYSELHWKALANHLTITVLTLREEGLGALFVVTGSEDAVKTLTKGKRYNQSSVEFLYSQLFQGRNVLSISPQLLCNAAGLDGAVVIDTAGTVRGIGCIFSAIGRRTPTEGARTKAALFGSKCGIALKLSQDGEIGLYSQSESIYAAFSPIG